YNNVLSVFIHCNDMEKRKERTRERHPEIEEKNLMSFISKADKKRANYYSFYTDQTWGDSRYYDMSIDTAVFGIDKSAEVIAQAVKTLFNK
ncbi:MAG: cytidylate kinase family protein, partial [Clostridia bacterium]